LEKLIFILKNRLQATVTAHDIPINNTNNLTQYADEATILHWVWTIVGIMAALSVLLIVSIFVRRSIGLYRLNIEKKYTDPYQNLLAEFLYDNKNVVQQAQILAYPALFKTQILLFHKNLDGTEAAQLRQLYRDLGFPKKALWSLKYALSWRKRLASMQELRAMQVEMAYPVIFQKIHDKNPEVRLAAMQAVLEVSDAPFSFLNGLKYPLSNWQEIHLFQTFEALSSDRQVEIQTLIAPFLTKKETKSYDFAQKVSVHYGAIDFTPPQYLSIKN
jgi:hypothetical protein